jgi:hypothetical protein
LGIPSIALFTAIRAFVPASVAVNAPTCRLTRQNADHQRRHEEIRTGCPVWIL